MIWLSVNFDVFIVNLLRLWYEKILLFTSVNLWGDYLLIAMVIAVSIHTVLLEDANTYSTYTTNP